MTTARDESNAEPTPGLGQDFADALLLIFGTTGAAVAFLGTTALLPYNWINNARVSVSIAQPAGRAAGRLGDKYGPMIERANESLRLKREIAALRRRSAEAVKQLSLLHETGAMDDEEYQERTVRVAEKLHADLRRLGLDVQEALDARNLRFEQALKTLNVQFGIPSGYEYLIAWEAYTANRLLFDMDSHRPMLLNLHAKRLEEPRRGWYDGRLCDWFEIANQGDAPLRVATMAVKLRTSPPSASWSSHRVGVGDQRYFYCGDTSWGTLEIAEGTKRPIAPKNRNR